jgi:hypothetical protein
MEVFACHSRSLVSRPRNGSLMHDGLLWTEPGTQLWNWRGADEDFFCCALVHRVAIGCGES